MSRHKFFMDMTGIAAVVAAVSFAVTVAPEVMKDAQICEQFGSATIQGGRYVVTNNRWGTDAPQCVDVTDTGFVVTRADGASATYAPKSFPTVFYGCHHGNCGTSDNVLSPNGMQASDPRFRDIRTSVSMTTADSGAWDAVYDIWFNKSMPTKKTEQNDGAEVMVWLNHRGKVQPIGSKVGTATIAGATWDVWEGDIGWNVISYVRQSPTTSMSFGVADFFDDVVSRGYGSNTWYLTSIQAGFEPWDSGVGLAVNSFEVTTS